jgi:putative spermidine/putrescine transport system permease protein
VSSQDLPLAGATRQGGAFVAGPPRGRGSGRGRRTSSLSRAARVLVLVLVLGYLILPLISMPEFATRGPQETRTLDPFISIVRDSNQGLFGSIVISLGIAALTVLGMILLLVPTMAWAYLRVPRMLRVIEFLCLLPLAIPAVVLVVGIAPIYRLLLINVSSSSLILFFVDIILVLPYAFRAIDGGLRGADVRTLADAGRSLGAGWPRIMAEIIVPNVRSGILNASVLAVALVLGEYTISSLLSFQTLQVVIYALGKRDASIAVAVAFAALLFVFVLLFIITRYAPGGAAGQAPEEEGG